MAAEVLSLSCDVLDEFRINMDAILKILIDKLIERDLQTGEVTAKIKVAVKTETGRDGLPIHTLAIEPDLKMKIGAKGQLKCKKQENIFLKYDADGNPIIGTKQLEIEEFIRERN